MTVRIIRSVHVPGLPVRQAVLELLELAELERYRQNERRELEGPFPGLAIQAAAELRLYRKRARRYRNRRDASPTYKGHHIPRSGPLEWRTLAELNVVPGRVWYSDDVGAPS